MKYLSLFLFLFMLFGCIQSNLKYSVTILDEDRINTEVLQSINEPDRALVSWYLFTYGNACGQSSDSNKCKLLAFLEIEDECSSKHIDYLRKWFSQGPIIQFKLKNCPAMAENSAIQNTIDRIIINRNSDTIAISYFIKGLNIREEKSWNVDRTDSFLINGDKMVQIQN